MRVKIGQENRAFNYVQMLSPLPEPGTVSVDFLALGSWYTLIDDGLGALTGRAVNHQLPDGQHLCHAACAARCAVEFDLCVGRENGIRQHVGLATFRPPEFSFDLAHQHRPGSLSVTWLSGGAMKTAVADILGSLSGDATGFVSHTTGLITIRPSAMLDAGGEFSLSYTWSPTVTETKPGLAARPRSCHLLDQVPVERFGGCGMVHDAYCVIDLGQQAGQRQRASRAVAPTPVRRRPRIWTPRQPTYRGTTSTPRIAGARRLLAAALLAGRLPCSRPPGCLPAIR